MYMLTELVHLNENEAECTIVIDGKHHRLKVKRDDGGIGLEGIKLFDAPSETLRLIHRSDYERDFVEQLCLFFRGATLQLPVSLTPHMP